MDGMTFLRSGTGGKIVAEFQEVMKQWRRMCADGSKEYSCQSCKMYSEIDESVCHGIPDEDEAKIIERYVMQWAEEHPEPVYPTWGEWLHSLHIVGVHAMRAPKPNFYYPIDDKFNDPIPADIAQKLGIEPKEG